MSDTLMASIAIHHPLDLKIIFSLGLLTVSVEQMHFKIMSPTANAAKQAFIELYYHAILSLSSFIAGFTHKKNVRTWRGICKEITVPGQWIPKCFWSKYLLQINVCLSIFYSILLRDWYIGTNFKTNTHKSESSGSPTRSRQSKAAHIPAAVANAQVRSSSEILLSSW